ncbi:MAG: alpha/beta hydrolase [Legionella sp.]|nr:alpha/beta hydrolase [Legionella sp.]
MKCHTLTIPGFTIACKIWGDAKNPPILALHGWLDNANSFDGIAEYLQHNFYFIAIDLPGHGLSSHLPEGCNYHFTDGIFNIIQIIRALELEKIHLLGHSMGACLASLLAGVSPECLLSLSLIEGLGPFSSPEETACKQLAQYATVLQKPIRKSKAYSLMDAAQARSAKGYVSFDIAKTLCERGLYEAQGIYYWRHDQRLLTPSPLYMTEGQIQSCLQKINVKTHLFWASDGFAFDSTLMQDRINSIKEIQITHLEGGHHIHMEQPEVVGKYLTCFYNGI